MWLDEDISHDIGSRWVVNLGVKRDDHHGRAPGIEHRVRHPGRERETVGLALDEIIITQTIGVSNTHQSRAKDDSDLGAMNMIMVAANRAGDGHNEVGVPLRREFPGMKRLYHEPSCVGGKGHRRGGGAGEFSHEKGLCWVDLS